MVIIQDGSAMNFSAIDEKEKKSEKNLRPKNFNNFIGQELTKKNLAVILSAAKKRQESPPHLLFYGPPGLGKTTLAGIVADESGGNLKTTSGPAIEKAGDLAAILTNLKPGDVLFIDEIHRLRLPIEEILYSALEDFFLDLVVGKGPGAKSMRLKLPAFTLIGATTKFGLLSSPLRERFGANFKIDFYSPENLQMILKKNAETLNIKIQKNAIEFLSKVSRGTPRVANRLLRRLRDFANFENKTEISEKNCQEWLQKIGVDKIGLTNFDREFLKIIVEKFSGGPVGLSTIAAAISEDKQTIEDIVEPFLLQIGFLSRTPRGRMILPEALKYLQIASYNA